MAVTRVGNSIELTAAADAVTFASAPLAELRFSGATLTAGQSLVVKDKASGQVLARHVIAAANEDVALLSGAYERWVSGIYIDTMPASGGTVLAVLG